MSRRQRETDLFEALGGEAADPGAMVDVVLVHEGESAKAWLLRRSGAPGGAKWAPKSLVRRAEPPHQDVFEMPRWVAAERGWL